ncbi:hypothetical protein [Niabella ginsenosidivorans]|uniref:hypothetical protein n=1 Tax=Niabella ginsenosidivorans TaxID=1176587 RepID=UPI000A0198F0|nr:hypothetical protein [Niabella ginsenosidivorans]
MKLSPLLAQYLLNHKELSLPGLGTFYAETYGGPENATVKFEQKPVEQFDNSVIAYISEETGKMKVLATSDLQSQLEDAIRFLNTGKPYLFAGIGTLLKKADGTYDFVPNTQTEPPKKKEVPFTERNTVPQAYIEEKRSGSNSRSKRPAIMIIVLVVVAIGATVWFYSKTARPKEAPVTGTAETGSAVDTAAHKNTAQPAAGPTVVPAAASGMVTYILETTREPRASKRYNQLKKIDWPVELEKIDSLHYNILMKLQTLPADTARVRDSLTIISGRKVTIRNN